MDTDLGPEGTPRCREPKVIVGQFCLLIVSLTPPHRRAILKEALEPSLVCERHSGSGRHFKETIWERIIASHKSSEDSGETLLLLQHI